MAELGRFSFGHGDRFGQQGEAQLNAIIKAKEEGVDITPVWNKSHREHKTVGTSPAQVKEEAEKAVNALGWEGPYFVDADHINLGNVRGYLASSSFFTIDVADYINKKAEAQSVQRFLKKAKPYTEDYEIPGVGKIEISQQEIEEIADKFLFATYKAGEIFRYIVQNRESGHMVFEVSMDEVDEAQSPVELFFILLMLADQQLPVSTIAPKFTGRFNKGVDYVGNVDVFRKEFEQDVLVIRHAAEEFGMSPELKLSVHSGSDKFSIYPAIKEVITQYDAGLHLKTAGTTWLEELIGLAEAGGKALDFCKEIYAGSLDRYLELAGPYSTVIDIHKDKLPTGEEVNGWDGDKFANSLRHIEGHADYNPHFRQLLHVAYKLAAEKGDGYMALLQEHKEIVGRNVTENLYERHIKPLFL